MLLLFRSVLVCKGRQAGASSPVTDEWNDHHSVVGRGRTGIILASNRAWAYGTSPRFFSGGTMTNRRTALRSIALASAGLVTANSRTLASWIPQAIDGKAAGAVATDEDFWATIRLAYDVERTIVNLNNGGVAPAPRPVIDAQRRGIEFTNELPARNLWQTLEPRAETVRLGLARMMGTTPDEIAIMRNASEALQTIQLGLTLRAGDEVVTTEHDYPRMITAWQQRSRRDGVVMKQVPMPIPLQRDADIVDAISQAITSRTRVVHISHVVFITGQVMPVAAIAALARSKGIECIVDGAHSFAQVPCSLDALGCDFFGTSLHKWLSAPIGTGMLAVRKNRIKDIWPLMAAPDTMDADIRKFEEIGTHPAAIHNAIADAIAFHEAIGLDRKRARFRHLHNTWYSMVRGHSRISLATRFDDPSQQGALVLMSIDGVKPADLSAWLLDKHRIFTVAIEIANASGLRVAPNVYTSTAEMERFGSIIADVASGKVVVPTR